MSLEMLDRFRDIINNYKNPYPKDVFIWNNEAMLDITRGRFNEFIYNIVENMRETLRYELIVLKIETEKEVSKK